MGCNPHAPHHPLHKGRAEPVLRPNVQVKPLPGSPGSQDRLRAGRRGASRALHAETGRQSRRSGRIHIPLGPTFRPAAARRPRPALPPTHIWAGTAEPRPGEGLGEQRFDAVAVEEIPRQPPQAQPQGLRGQVLAAEAGPDQEARHPDKPVESRPPGLRVPAGPAVAGREGGGRAGEHEAAEPAVVRADQIAQLPPGSWFHRGGRGPPVRMPSCPESSRAAAGPRGPPDCGRTAGLGESICSRSYGRHSGPDHPCPELN